MTGIITSITMTTITIIIMTTIMNITTITRPWRISKP